MPGKIAFDNVLEGVTYREESDEQTGFKEKVIIETRDKTKNPILMKLSALAAKFANKPADLMLFRNVVRNHE